MSGPSDKAAKEAARRARAIERKRNRARFRDTVCSVVFFAAGFYVVLAGVLGMVGHPRGVAPDLGPSLYWFAYIVSGMALLAGGLMVLRHQMQLRIAWWLCVIAAVPGLLLWLWGMLAGVVKMAGGGGPSAGAEVAALGIVIAFLLLGVVGLRRAQAGYVEARRKTPKS